MLDITQPVQTRDGKPARIIATDIKGDTEGKIIALIDTGEEEILAIRLANGHLLLDGEKSPVDLVNTPVRETLYMNVGQTYGSVTGAQHDEWPVLKVEVEFEGDLMHITKVVSAELA
jgi:hypothetical protein